jgi:hypothetical protein
LIADELNVTVYNGQRPWQTIKPLFGFRNDIAHGKPETITTEKMELVNEQLDHKLGTFVRTEWELLCTLENAERSRVDVEEILNILHAAAPHLKDDLGPLQPGFQMHSAVYKPGGS